MHNTNVKQLAAQYFTILAKKGPYAALAWLENFSQGMKSKIMYEIYRQTNSTPPANELH
jgi:hypothetical protein